MVEDFSAQLSLLYLPAKTVAIITGYPVCRCLVIYEKIFVSASS